MYLAEDTKAREEGPSWPERVWEVLRRIFVPDRQPVLVPVPVVVRPGAAPRRY
jgi:hypothetical protein